MSFGNSWCGLLFFILTVKMFTLLCPVLSAFLKLKEMQEIIVVVMDEKLL